MKKLFFFLIPLVMWSCSQDEALLAAAGLDTGLRQ